MVYGPNFDLMAVWAVGLVAASLLLGGCSLLFAQGGKHAGTIVGVLLVLTSVVVLALAWDASPRHWWLSLLPFYLGVQSIRSWRKPESTGWKIRLSSFMFLAAVCATLFGGVAQLMHQRRTEAPVVKALELLIADHGSVDTGIDGIATSVFFFYGDQSDMNEFVSLVAQLRSVQLLQVGGTLSEADLTPLLKLRRLKNLTLQRTDLTDNQLTVLSELPRLETLDIMLTKVTDAGIVQLADTKTLKRLWPNEEVTPTALDKLEAALPKLSISRSK